jgi:hypothetical protein
VGPPRRAGGSLAIRRAVPYGLKCLQPQWKDPAFIAVPDVAAAAPFDLFDRQVDFEALWSLPVIAIVFFSGVSLVVA